MLKIEKRGRYRKVWKQEDQLRDNGIFLKIDDHDLDLCGSGEKCLDSGYSLKLHFLMDWILGGNRKRRSR